MIIDKFRLSLNRTSAWSFVLLIWIGVNLVVIYCSEWYALPKRSKVSEIALRSYSAKILPAISLTSPAVQTRSLKYRVLEPTEIGRPQPLLLFLHGAGQRGDDNESQLLGLPSQLIEPDWRARCPGFVLAPQCPSDSDWVQELPALISLLETWRADPRVDRRRIYVTGLSMGGYGTWHLAAARPEWIAAAAPICGGGNPDSASALRRVLLWAVHGSDDRVVPAQQSRDMINAIKAIGGSCRYTELPGVGHDSWTQTFRDPNGVLAWMYQQTAPLP